MELKLVVAKSYQKYKTIGEPFKENGRMYILVELKNKVPKQVRWYSEVEYAKMYPEAVVNKSQDPGYKPQKIVLGFEKGYITIFKGAKEEHEEWFRQSICRFAKWWGWYVPSNKEVPKDLPSGVQPVRLGWNGMGTDEDRLDKSTVVTKHVQATLSKFATSQRQGNIGDRLILVIHIVQRIESENHYGKLFEYIMKDQKGNYYKWVTAAKDWEVGTHHIIRGSIKDFGEFEGEPLTILTRCMEEK